jgi:hypothetical protein
MTLRDRITLVERPKRWLNQQAAKHHYMHRPVPLRALPFGWGIRFDDQDYLIDQKDGLKRPAGFIIFSLVHFTKLRGEFGYPGLPTQWQVLHLCRLWLHDDLPKNSETCVMAKAHHLVQHRWLEVHPPVFPDLPYHILKIISWADTRFHVGTVYKAANYRFFGETISAPRHGKKIEGEPDRVLRCFILDLPEPRWTWEPTKLQLSLFEEGVPCD